jgi:FkbM family methyltransferase
MKRNFCRHVLENGGSIVPLMIPPDLTGGTGLMNPSIFFIEDELYANIRHINYILYHSEAGQLFQNRYGPLAYLNPENDIRLATTNFMCRLDPKTLLVQEVFKVDTSKLDIKPVWEFHGLEDARIIVWNDKIFLSGVRRDVKENGEGRIELSELKKDASVFREIHRTRIPATVENSYCEKNWMPIVDMPYHWVKWTNPTEIVKYDPKTKKTETVIKGDDYITGISDLRGGSQVYYWKDGMHIAIVHEVCLFVNKLNQKDAWYYHRLVIWDKDWRIIKLSDNMSFMDGAIEFCAGLVFIDNDIIITFGFQDNGAYALRIPEKIVDELLEMKNNDQNFDWGLNAYAAAQQMEIEIFQHKIYEVFNSVKKNDIVVDIGSNVGMFARSIDCREIKEIICVEPSKNLFPTLLGNTKAMPACCCNYGIGLVTGKQKMKHKYQIYASSTDEYDVLSFKDFRESLGLTHIDFMKVDCEGGEYDIFIKENKEFLEKNVKYISAEFHLRDFRDQFVRVRNEFLSSGNVKIMTAYDINIFEDITDKIFNDHYLDVYIKKHGLSSQLMIYIDNR